MTRETAATTRSWAELVPEQAPWLQAHQAGEAPEGCIPHWSVSSTQCHVLGAASACSLVSNHSVQFAPLPYAWVTACPSCTPPRGSQVQSHSPPQVSGCRVGLWEPCKPCSEHSLPMPGPCSHFSSEQGRLQSLGYVRCSARTMSPSHIPLGSPSTGPSSGWLWASASTPRYWDSACGCSPACSRLGEHGSHFPHVRVHSLVNLPSVHALQVDETTLLPSHLATLLSLFQLL